PSYYLPVQPTLRALHSFPPRRSSDLEDLALAYTPGVAEPCKVIAKDEEAAYKYTIKSNTIAVVSDGSAVLGLGNIGAKAAMPVVDRKSTRLNSSHVPISYAVFCLKKK